MGAKLNKVATRYSWEGSDCFYLAVASSNCEDIFDMFLELFCPPSQLDLKDLQEPQQKNAHTEAAEFEEKMPKQDGMPDTSKEIILYPASFPIPTKFSVEKEFHPTVGYFEEVSKARGKMVSRTFYHYTIYTRRSQNKDSMYNHTRCHLNILIWCAWPKCGKKCEAPEGLKEHITKKHSGLLSPGTQSINRSFKFLVDFILTCF